MGDLTAITAEHLQDLLLVFMKTMYDANTSTDPNSFSSQVISRCEALFKLDYNLMELANPKGELCPHYPSRIFIPESEKAPVPVTTTSPAANTASASPTTSIGHSPQPQPQPQPPNQPTTIYENTLDINELRNMVKNSKFARCRARFPVPVILYRGKYICRSATLSGYAEMFGRGTIEDFWCFRTGETAASADVKRLAAQALIRAAENALEGENADVVPDAVEKAVYAKMTYLDAIRQNDVTLLEYMNVNSIADFMVEMKKVKYGLNVSSSEKADKENRYAKFYLAVMPYPGCEFFKAYRKNAHSPRDIFYNWSDEFNNADIQIADIQQYVQRNRTNGASTNNGNVRQSASHPSASTAAVATAAANTNNGNSPSANSAAAANGQTKYAPLDIRWSDYQRWDLMTMTHNYLRSLLHNLRYSNTGMLVHCISGWDRTPLFVSLLRLTLWADGVIHQSLNSMQMLYLTIGYDWFLFGHNLPDRLYKGEDILFFCFNMLKYIHGREMCTVQASAKPSRSKHNSCSSGGAGGGKPETAAEAASGEMYFEQDELDYADEESRSLNMLVYPNSNAANADNSKNGNELRTKRDRTYSGRSVSSTNSEPPNADHSSTECMFEVSLTDAPSNPEENASNANRTTPVSVPSGRRTRQESTSSTGSWQMVTNTGSFNPGHGAESFMHSHASAAAAAVAAESGAVSPAKREPIKSEIIGDVLVFEDDPMYDILRSRSAKLKVLRNDFHTHYWATIGRSKENGPLGAFLNSFVGKVGRATKVL